jgi:hypothetical protein
LAGPMADPLDGLLASGLALRLVEVSVLLTVPAKKALASGLRTGAAKVWTTDLVSVTCSALVTALGKALN